MDVFWSPHADSLLDEIVVGIAEALSVDEFNAQQAVTISIQLKHIFQSVRTIRFIQLNKHTPKASFRGS